MTRIRLFPRKTRRGLVFEEVSCGCRTVTSSATISRAAFAGRVFGKHRR
jgi:hypothetical protein